MKFYKKPMPVEAEKWNGDADLANRFIGEGYGADWEYTHPDSANIVIPCILGPLLCEVGDWIVKSDDAGFEVVKPEAFAEKYEPIVPFLPPFFPESEARP